MKVVIRDRARADLDHIFDRIAADRPVVAETVIERILRSIELLGGFPRMGRRGRLPTTYERVVTGLPYIVVYRINEAADEVSVVSVVHAAQDRR
jgi:toxin ParE1/3/4